MPARYAKTDAASLAYLRRELLRPHYTAVEVGAGVAVAATAVGGPPHTRSLAVCGTLASETRRLDLNELASALGIHTPRLHGLLQTWTL